MKKKLWLALIFIAAIASIVYFSVYFSLELSKNALLKGAYDEKDYSGMAQSVFFKEPDIGQDEYLGANSAPLSIIFALDFESNDATEYFNEAMPQLKEKYVDVGEAKLYFKYVLSRTELNNKSGRYWKVQAGRCFLKLTKDNVLEYHSAIFKRQDDDLSGFGSDAQALGADGEQFGSCMRDTSFTATYADMLDTEDFTIYSPSMYLGIDGSEYNIIYGRPELDYVFKRMRLKEIRVGLG